MDRRDFPGRHRRRAGRNEAEQGKRLLQNSGPFHTRLSLSSANVDEVIQARLLAKRPEVVDELQNLFKEKGDILKNQLTFKNCGMT